ncbi:death-associated protein-like 1 [Calypte anna]|uniref:death-associated protein-like 1 n=1 Tax=Calypte anna TaxID=9244 RepID=UPI0011C38901|nr:death-associated protein-like 1 [Calypte anna]
MRHRAMEGERGSSVLGTRCLRPEGTAVKAGGMRVPKKQENRPVEKNAKPPGKEKSSAITSFSKTQTADVLLAEALRKMSHRIHAAALQVAHQKPQPALEKYMLPKRIYIIQQPRKC